MYKNVCQKIKKGRGFFAAAFLYWKNLAFFVAVFLEWKRILPVKEGKEGIRGKLYGKSKAGGRECFTEKRLLLSFFRFDKFILDKSKNICYNIKKK